MNAQNWAKRISRRSDISMGLVHLTKKTGDLEAFQVLMKILQEQKLIGSTNQTINGSPQGFICGNNPVVCFQDVPLFSVSENILLEQQIREEIKSPKIRYSDFGLRFDKRYIFEKGGRPVIYEKTETAKKFLPQEEYWRIVRLDLEDSNNIIDWTHEREWRIKGDFNFELNQVEILLSNQNSVKSFYNYCENENMLHIFKEVKGIITLKSLVL